jgi:hypothetical protein
MSLWRITKSLLSPETYTEWPIDKLLGSGLTFDDVSKSSLPTQGLFMFNIPHLFNFNQKLDDIHFIFNLRDPRDLVCNQYAWEFVHPVPHLTEEQLNARRESIRTEGIDQYVLRKDNRASYEPLLKLYRHVKDFAPVFVSSYAQLCVGTTEIIPRLAQYLGNKNSELVKRLVEAEHPSTLVNSKNWVGLRWAGSDVLPGRARVELKPETFAELTRRNADLLESLAELDRPDYLYFYS